MKLRYMKKGLATLLMVCLLIIALKYYLLPRHLGESLSTLLEDQDFEESDHHLSIKIPRISE